MGSYAGPEVLYAEMTSGSAHTIRAMVSDLDDCLNAVDEGIDDEAYEDEAYESDWHDEISDPVEAELENESGSWRIDPSTDAQTVVNPTRGSVRFTMPEPGMLDVGAPEFETARSCRAPRTASCFRSTSRFRTGERSPQRRWAHHARSAASASSGGFGPSSIRSSSSQL